MNIISYISLSLLTTLLGILGLLFCSICIYEMAVPPRTIIERDFILNREYIIWTIIKNTLAIYSIIAITGEII